MRQLLLIPGPRPLDERLGGSFHGKKRKNLEKIMTNPRNAAMPQVSISALDAIYHRRSVRDYTPQTIDQAVIRALLDAAVHAPTAMHQEPWSFAVIQDKNLLNRLSDTTKELLRREAQGSDSHHAQHTLELVNKPEFHVFYNAGTLIVIYGKFQGPFVAADCWLAAENLLLAACAKGLGACVIGLAVSALNTQDWKAELKIPAEMTAIAPIIVGAHDGETPPVSRKQPDVVAWK
jgi:nitroreductase